jgi:hypothetical protein
MGIEHTCFIVDQVSIEPGRFPVHENESDPSIGGIGCEPTWLM